ncbi:hypothetical protein FA13DRAFT_1798700 [Coprinellus micaceus]|uniref:Uncharacterized protein n=1 Tax=Coprinellus micaceus TaxID=71717 RepID=A0A4Y7SL68_COPMI|nr:hypothetical protein FA13DRAFT_1798700 [Coprinellus micaceus]
MLPGCGLCTIPVTFADCVNYALPTLLPCGHVYSLNCAFQLVDDHLPCPKACRDGEVITSEVLDRLELLVGISTSPRGEIAVTRAASAACHKRMAYQLETASLLSGSRDRGPTMIQQVSRLRSQFDLYGILANNLREKAIAASHSHQALASASKDGAHLSNKLSQLQNLTRCLDQTC